MLNKTTKILIEGQSTIDNKVAARFMAMIDIDNPKDMSLTSRYINKDLCRQYRDTIRADQNAFEDHAYSVQDKVLASINS